MLCAKCKKNEATVHVTTVVGTEQETVHYCSNCAPLSPGGLDHEKAMAKARSIMAEKCEVCGLQAFSEWMLAGRGPTYLCFDCDPQLRSIVMELVKTETEEAASSHLSSDPVLSLRSLQLLKERRRLVWLHAP